MCVKLLQVNLMTLYLMVMLVETHLNVHANKLAQMSVSVGILSTKH